MTFQEKVDLIGKYKDKNDKFASVYKYGKNIDSPKLNDEQKEKVRKNVEVAYDAIKQMQDKKPTKTTTAKGGAKKKTMLGLASEIKKRDNVSWDEAKKRAKRDYESEKKKAISEEKQKVSEFKKQVGKIKFTRATTKTDIKKDKVLPALPSGKRYPKRGTTTNKYGTFKNDPKRPYWENRANRMDVNQPSKSVYPKLADGGEMKDGKFTYKDYFQAQGGIKFQSEEEAKQFIKSAKPFVRKQLRGGDLVLVYNGKEYFIAEKVMIDDKYAKGGEVEEMALSKSRLEFAEYNLSELEKEGKTSSNSSQYREWERFKKQYENKIKRLEETLNPTFPKIKMENISDEDLKKKHTRALWNVNELRLGNLKPSKVIKTGRVTKEKADQFLMDIAKQYEIEMKKRGMPVYAQGGTAKRIKRMGC